MEPIYWIGTYEYLTWVKKLQAYLAYAILIRMKGGLRPHGYTIVEVLIFMAVSGLMFVMAVVFVNGKQSSVEFRQGIYEVNSELRNVINEVSDGRSDALSFGTTTNCTASAGGGAPQIKNTLSKEQGTNGGVNGCIFLGKVVQFGDTNFAPDTATYYDVFTLAARQVTATNEPVTSFLTAQPIAIHTIPTVSSKTLTISRRMPAGLEITAAYQCNNTLCSSRSPIGAIGFFGSFNAALGVAAGSGQSGSQTITTAVIPSSSLNAAPNTAAANINTNTQNIGPTHIIGNQPGNPRYVLLCFRNGERRGSIVIGGINGQAFTTQVKIGPMPTVTGCF